MLMLVVVIIIAAIVSGFAGGLVGTQKKAPTLSMDVKVVNTGDWRGSGFFATVTSVSQPIPTNQLKIVTSWTEHTDRDNVIERIDTLVHTTTTVANGSSNINTLFDPTVSLSGLYAAPFGSGPGVNGTESTGSSSLTYSLPQQQFGNYSLMQGTTLSAQPAGAPANGDLGSSAQGNGNGGYDSSNASYTYQQYVPGTTTYYWSKNGGVTWNGCNYATYLSAPSHGYLVKEVTSSGTYTPVTVPATGGTQYAYNNCGSSCIDPAKAVLGPDWTYARWGKGDTINVKVIYIPTGSVIFNQNVPVTES
jgi:hypothetical protein